VSLQATQATSRSVIACQEAPLKHQIERRLGVLLACAVAALFLVGVAGAAGSASFPDPVGDGGSSLDITRLDVSNHDGIYDFQVTVAGHFDPVLSELRVAIDTDQNPDTGSAFYGTEVEIAYEAGSNAREGEAVLLRATGWDFRGATPPEGWGWGYGPNSVEFFATPAELGIAPDAGFNIVAAAMGPHPDTAPDIRTFNYQPVPGTPPLGLGPDSRAPHLLAYPSSGAHGKLAKLNYWVLDGRGRTAETIRIYRRSRLLKTIRRPLRDSNPFDPSQVAWRVPSNVRGRLRFSVRSVDAAGNKSKLSWASLDVH
jgi:hypothetical protein